MTKYKTILIDPPYYERGAGKCVRGANKHYDIMPTIEIKILLEEQLRDKVAEDCHLYLWVTNNFLEDGLEIMKFLGFRYITNLVWVKDKMGLGQYFRGKHELCLFGVKGKFTRNSRKETTLIKSSRTKHSKKPYDIYTKIEAISDPPRLELFARHKREGWGVFGNEVPNETQRILK